MQRTARPLGIVHAAGLPAHAVGIEVGKNIQLRIEALDLPEMRLCQLNNRDLSRAHQFQLAHSGQQNQFLRCSIHGLVGVVALSSSGVDGNWW